MSNSSFPITNVSNQTFPVSPPAPLPLPPLILLLDGIGFILVGLLGQLSSIFVAVVIFRNKSLRTPCFQLIGGGAIGSLMVAAHYFGRGIDYLREYSADMFVLERPVLVCLLVGGTEGLFGIPFHTFITTLVGLDRTISLLAPIKYRSLEKRYAVYLLMGAAVLAIAGEVVAFASAPLQRRQICRSFPEALNPTFNAVFGWTCSTCNILNVLIYLIMLASFAYRKRRFDAGGTTEQRAFFKRQSVAMPTVRSMLLLYFVFGIVPDNLINVSQNYDRTIYRAVDIARGVGNFLKACSSLIEIVSLMTFSKKFRECAKATFKCNTSNVINISISGSGAQQNRMTV